MPSESVPPPNELAAGDSGASSISKIQNSRSVYTSCSSGVLDVEVDLDEIHEGEETDSEMSVIGGLKWRVRVDSNDENLRVILTCDGPASGASFGWVAKVSRSFVITSYLKDGVDFVVDDEQPVLYTEMGKALGHDELIEMKSLTAGDRGFSHDGQIHVKVGVEVLDMEGVRPVLRPDFTATNCSLADGTVLVGEKKFNVAKQLLALHSSYFDSLFFGSFPDSEKKVNELKGIDPVAFEQLLKLVYPGKEEVTEKNVAAVTQLADMFQMPLILDRCTELLLKNDCTLTMAVRILLAGKYCVPEMHILVERIKDMKAVKAVIESAEFKEMDEETKTALLGKCARLTK